jgi:glycosyltransferase involved in cell wall biosynthesis
MPEKILFILHLPPPVHGASMVGQFIKESAKINQPFNARYINLGTSRSVNDIGRNPLRKVFGYLSILFSTLRQLLFRRPALVYMTLTAKGMGFYKDAIISLLAKWFGVPLVLHFHNKGVSNRQDHSLDHFFYKKIFKNTRVILLSKYLYPDVKKYVREADVYYCPNGIPQLKSGEGNKKSANNQVQLLFLSNLIASKGVFVLLEALKILKEKNLEFTSNFVGGEGNISKEAFNNKVKALQLENHVHFLGEKYDQEKGVLFSEADVFVHPSYHDCFPLVLLEASQFGLPIVSTYEGAIPEIIQDGVNGFLVKQQDIAGLANRLEKLILDEDLRRKLGNAAFEKYKNEYTLEHFENRMLGILENIMLELK